jgi:hypothetical protein
MTTEALCTFLLSAASDSISLTMPFNSVWEAASYTAGSAMSYMLGQALLFMNGKSP